MAQIIIAEISFPDPMGKKKKMRNDGQNAMRTYK